MSIGRKVKRNALKKAYRKFTTKWRQVKRQQIADLEEKAEEKRGALVKMFAEQNGVSEEDAREHVPLQHAAGQTLGKKPPFKYWSTIVAKNLEQAKATPQEVKDFAEETDLTWDEPVVAEEKKP